jgi:hypothetical protein
MRRLLITAIAAVMGQVHAQGGSVPETGASTVVPAAHSQPGPTAGIQSNGSAEMLDRMQAAVQEVAELYGNPPFLEVFTNDPERAQVLKGRLKGLAGSREMEARITALTKQREQLESEILIKRKESDRLTQRLILQRRALDALADAMDRAKAAVEDTAAPGEVVAR